MLAGGILFAVGMLSYLPTSTGSEDMERRLAPVRWNRIVIGSIAVLALFSLLLWTRPGATFAAS
jgi:hypothetical protein